MNNGNVYLIGMMGSGKTVTGKTLADFLGDIFFELVEFITDIFEFNCVATAF